MGDQQRLVARGRMSEIEDRLRELGNLIEGDINSINFSLFLAVHGVAGLKIDQAAAEFRQLQEHCAEHSRLTGELTKLREAWG